LASLGLDLGFDHADLVLEPGTFLVGGRADAVASVPARAAPDVRRLQLSLLTEPGAMRIARLLEQVEQRIHLHADDAVKLVHVSTPSARRTRAAMSAGSAERALSGITATGGSAARIAWSSCAAGRWRARAAVISTGPPNASASRNIVATSAGAVISGRTPASLKPEAVRRSPMKIGSAIRRAGSGSGWRRSGRRS